MTPGRASRLEGGPIGKAHRVRQSLPDDLPPNRRADLDALLSEVPLVPHREHEYGGRYRDRPRCWKCGKAGKLGGHHLADGTVVWVHKRCHRRIHGKGRQDIRCTA